jgi:DNA-directed RNA polymerase specialized sigma24 family protein
VTTEQQLVLLAREGDHNAFSQLCALKIGTLTALARLILRDEYLAREAVQDALIDAWRGIRGVRDPERFDAWLRRILVRACYGRANESARRRRLEIELGTVDQVKVTVFGPAVNLASRLEGMTKTLRASILLDAVTAQAVRQQVPRDLARVRRLAVVRPYGMDASLEVSELLPPEADYPLLTDEHLKSYEAALDAFLVGHWAEAYELLHRTPAADQASDFLTVYIAQLNRRAPPGWDGVIPLSSK